jgi:Flp pilus assembly secretin CpaC
MHARSGRRGAILLALGLCVGQVQGQDVELNPPSPMPPDVGAPAAGEAPAEQPKKPPVMRGKAVPFENEWIVNLNSIERYALPPGFTGFYETPYSTRAEIADVRLVPPAKGQGLANTFILETKDLLGTADIVFPVLMEDGSKQEKRIEILVVDQVSQAYRSYLLANIKKMFPTSSVDVLVANSQTAVLNGYVERTEHVAPIVDLVRGFLAARVAQSPDAITVVNALRVVGAMQVQLKVLIAEVQRSKTRDLGFDWNYFGTTANPWLGAASAATGSFSNRLLGANTTNGLTTSLGSTASGGANLNFVINRNGQAVFQGFLRALVTNNLAKILAEPNLVTTSGQPAYFNVGGQVPVLTPQGNGTIAIQYRDFGTNLRFVPTVLGEGRVRLEVRPEVSDLNFGNGVQLGNIIVPGFDVRVAETTIEMEAGQSFVVAGLLQKRVIANANKFPVVADIPLAGTLFQNKSYRQIETEIMIMVTPHLVEALDQAPCELPGRESRTPNDIEYYLGSKFEPPCFGDPYKGHIKNWANNVPDPQPVPVPMYDRQSSGIPNNNSMMGGPIMDQPINSTIPLQQAPADAELVPPNGTELPTPEVPTETIEAVPSPGSETNANEIPRNYGVGYRGLPETDAPVPTLPAVAVPETEFTPVSAPPKRPVRSAWRRGGTTGWR